MMERWLYSAWLWQFTQRRCFSPDPFTSRSSSKSQLPDSYYFTHLLFFPLSTFPLRFVCPEGGDTELLGWTHCGSEHQTQLLWSAARRATHHNSCCSTGSSVDSSIPFPHINRSHLQCFVCVSESDKRLKLTGFEALSDEISQNFFNTLLSSRDFKQVV